MKNNKIQKKGIRRLGRKWYIWIQVQGVHKNLYVQGFDTIKEAQHELIRHYGAKKAMTPTMNLNCKHLNR